LHGGNGNDTLWGGANTDVLDGGAGINKIHQGEDPNINMVLAQIDSITS
jgi:Ca2+-binding RTX toxin-like protein